MQVAAAIMASTGHKNPSVRCKVACHLDGCVQGSNGQRLAGAGPDCAELASRSAAVLSGGALTRPLARHCCTTSEVCLPGPSGCVLQQAEPGIGGH